MGFYERHVLPKVIDWACSMSTVRKQREKVIPRATGRVLEIGMGSGLNLPFYEPDQVEFVWGLEPSEGMRTKCQPAADAAPFEVKFLDLPGEEIPLEDHSADTVVLTYTLCSIERDLEALAQMRRVLRPDGRLLFCEHGRAPDASVRKWQARIEPAWGMFSGGCKLSKPIVDLISHSGFEILEEDSMYLPGGFRFAGFNTWGSARTA